MPKKSDILLKFKLSQTRFLLFFASMLIFDYLNMIINAFY